MRRFFSSLGNPEPVEIQTANSRDNPVCQQGNLTLYARGMSGRSVVLNFPKSLVSDSFASNLVSLRSLLLLGWTVDWQRDRALLHTPDNIDTVILRCSNGMYIFPPLFVRPRHIEAQAATTRRSTPPTTQAAPPSQQATSDPSSLRVPPCALVEGARRDPE